MSTEIQKVLEAHAASRLEQIGRSAAASAIQAWVDHGAVFEAAVGVAQFDPVRPFDAETPMDLASVTKVFTATLAMIAIDRGLVQFDEQAPELPGVTLLHLLNHSSGLPAWDKFYERMPMNPRPAVAEATKAEILRQIAEKPRSEPGTVSEYSDLGYIYLGVWIERLFDRGLEELVEQLIAGALGLSSIRYVSLRRGDAPLADAAATEVDPVRGGPVVGTVHDENCHIMGGVAGHAGLFGIARDVGAFGRHMLEISRGSNGIVSREVLKFAWSEAARGAAGHYLGGWDTPSGTQTSVGRGFSRRYTVGHLGFTGTSLWIDRSRDVVAVLLTNRVYPTRENPRVKDLRIAFHEAVLPP